MVNRNRINAPTHESVWRNVSWQKHESQSYNSERSIDVSLEKRQNMPHVSLLPFQAKSCKQLITDVSVNLASQFVRSFNARCSRRKSFQLFTQRYIDRSSSSMRPTFVGLRTGFRTIIHGVQIPQNGKVLRYVLRGDLIVVLMRKLWPKLTQVAAYQLSLFSQPEMAPPNDGFIPLETRV